MTIKLHADYPNISFEISVDGVEALVSMVAGQWMLRKDGGQTWLAKGQLHWTQALRRALDDSRMFTNAEL